MNEAILSVKDLSVYYGSVLAIKDVSIDVYKGEIVALIGPNGAGKSTCLRAICGILDEFNGRIGSGEILFLNEKINGLKPHQLVGKGLCLVPEGRKVFPTMSVLENLEMGGYTIKERQEIERRVSSVFEIFPILKERRNQRAGTLSSGEQQMLAICRALMLRPKMLLVDEPSLGLSPNYVETVFEKIRDINKSGTTVLLVEQNARMALEYADRGYVFNIGEIALEGTGKDLLENDNVRKSFLAGQ